MTVSGFWIDRHQVTNRDFAAFVADTDYVTVAERPLDPADYPGAPAANLAPGSLVFTRTADAVDLRHLSQWWTWTPKALPTEAQWELAARGGHDGAVYTWGDEPEPPGDALANYWHGAFPWRPDPGYGSTARVGSYAANGYGLYDMAGNVWEWTTDWYSPRHSDAAEHACCVPVDPRGDAVRDSLDPGQPQFAVPRKVIKGGSFLCADSYCMRREASSESIPIAPLGRIMRLLSGSSSQAFALTFDDSVGARPLVRARETPTAVQSLIAAAIAPMVAVTIWLALTNDHLQRPEAAGVYWSYLTASSMLIGVYWWIRRPASRFGPLLVAFGILVWIVSWQAADSPLLFDVAVLAEAPFFVLTFYLFLAFPMGRLEPRAARWLMGALGLGVLAFFVPWALFSPVSPAADH